MSRIEYEKQLLELIIEHSAKFEHACKVLKICNALQDRGKHVKLGVRIARGVPVTFPNTQIWVEGHPVTVFVVFAGANVVLLIDNHPDPTSEPTSYFKAVEFKDLEEEVLSLWT